MFGTNPIAKPRLYNFMLHSIFYTIQGEGPFAGQPAIFVRLAGCNLRCTWCDTEFDNGVQLTGDDLVTMIANMVEEANCYLIVITGGEPMLQPLRLLIDAPALASCQFQIETAGSVWPDGGLTAVRPDDDHLTIVCSPKTPSIVRQLQTATTYNVCWKYIIKASEPCDGQGLPKMSTQRQGLPMRMFRPDNLHYFRDRIFVQACDEGDADVNAANLKYVVSLALTYGYRLSIQQHKLIGVD
jgi:organic radical activating enzyme